MDPTVTEADVAAWRGRVRGATRYWVRRLAYRQDRQALVEDLESVGWIAVLEGGPNDLQIERRMHRAMKRATCEWLWGASRFTTVKDKAHRYPRRLTYQLKPSEFKSLHSQEPEPDRVAMARITLERVWAVLTIAQRLVWVCLVWYGGSIPRRVYHRWGWNSNMMHHRKMTLRRRALEVLR